MDIPNFFWVVLNKTTTHSKHNKFRNSVKTYQDKLYYSLWTQLLHLTNRKESQKSGKGFQTLQIFNRRG